jgi:ABC-type nitrate/sulfonate/bicarbonate transport system substrate-binding protein
MLYKRHRTVMAMAATVALLASVITLSPLAGGATHRRTSSTSHTSITLVTNGEATEGDGVTEAFFKYLKKNGIHFTQSVVTTSSDLIRVLVAGKADLGIVTPVQTVIAASNGNVGVKYLATDQASVDYDILSLPQFSLNNLNGATFGIEAPGTSGVIIGNAALQKSGVNTSTLHDVTIGDTGARVTAILAGRIDLAPALAPAAIPAIATGKVKLLLNAGKVLGPFLLQGLASTDAYIKEHPATVQKVVDSLIEAEQYSASNESGYIQLVNTAKLNGTLSMAEEQRVWSQFKSSGYFAPDGGICESIVKNTINLSYETGTLTKSATRSQSKWLDPSFVDKYLAQHHINKNKCE